MTTTTQTTTQTTQTATQPATQTITGQNRQPIVSLTKTAVGHVQKILSQTPNAKGLRVGVKKSGCSGFGYIVDCATEINASDVVYESEGVQMVVDEKSLPYLKGMHIDCITEGLNQVLKFINPNATGACGCGESFSVDE